MTFDEARKMKGYKFSLGNIECLLNDIRNNWMSGMEADGDRYIGEAVLEIGYVDIELNITTEEQVSTEPCNGNKKPVLDYFVCVKNFDWESEGYIDYKVNVDWHADNWKDQLERDMFLALDEYVKERGYHYNQPNYGWIAESRELAYKEKFA